MVKKTRNDDFFERVFFLVRKIPKGKVTTYGLIAQSLGMKSSARMVGWALNSVAGNIDIPCHRVINRRGELTGRRYFATPNLMRELLESEGIEFFEDKVNLDKHLWIPE
jgi:methylated-DNA-protein-cysteine methyltransferase related protein